MNRTADLPDWRKGKQPFKFLQARKMHLILQVWSIFGDLHDCVAIHSTNILRP